MKNKRCYFLVYGSLKQGYHNHSYLKGAEFIRNMTTEPKYTLFDGGFPIVERGGETAIQGELWFSEDPYSIQNVFDLESCSSQEQGHPDNWYDFDKISIKEGEAIMFVMDKGKSKRTKVLNNGIWK
jgi:gamma-glutamylcyclotransferase (GGCT)/AIG2-like uncharacterized protein YtfP